MSDAFATLLGDNLGGSSGRERKKSMAEMAAEKQAAAMEQASQNPAPANASGMELNDDVFSQLGWNAASPAAPKATPSTGASSFDPLAGFGSGSAGAPSAMGGTGMMGGGAQARAQPSPTQSNAGGLDILGFDPLAGAANSSSNERSAQTSGGASPVPTGGNTAGSLVGLGGMASSQGSASSLDNSATGGRQAMPAWTPIPAKPGYELKFKVFETVLDSGMGGESAFVRAEYGASSAKMPARTASSMLGFPYDPSVDHIAFKVFTTSACRTLIGAARISFGAHKLVFDQGIMADAAPVRTDYGDTVGRIKVGIRVTMGQKGGKAAGNGPGRPVAAPAATAAKAAATPRSTAAAAATPAAATTARAAVRPAEPRTWAGIVERAMDLVPNLSKEQLSEIVIAVVTSSEPAAFVVDGLLDDAEMQVLDTHRNDAAASERRSGGRWWNLGRKDSDAPAAEVAFANAGAAAGSAGEEEGYLASASAKAGAVASKIGDLAKSVPSLFKRKSNANAAPVPDRAGNTPSSGGAVVVGGGVVTPLGPSASSEDDGDLHLNRGSSVESFDSAAMARAGRPQPSVDLLGGSGGGGGSGSGMTPVPTVDLLGGGGGAGMAGVNSNAMEPDPRGRPIPSPTAGSFGGVPPPTATSTAGADVELDRDTLKAQHEAEKEAKATERLQEYKDHERRREEAEAAEEAAAARVDPIIDTWAPERKRGNIRALLATLDTIVWPEAKWKGYSISDLVEPKGVKRAYFIACKRVYPDKCQDQPAHIRLLSTKIAFLLNEAWEVFKKENPGV